MSTKKNKEDMKVDAAVEASFPASDAPSYGKDVGPDKLANFDAVAGRKDDEEAENERSSAATKRKS